MWFITKITCNEKVYTFGYSINLWFFPMLLFLHCIVLNNSHDTWCGYWALSASTTNTALKLRKGDHTTETTAWSFMDGGADNLLLPVVYFILFYFMTLSLFQLHSMVVDEWIWIWTSGGMILTGETWSTLSKICPIATLSTTNLT